MPLSCTVRVRASASTSSVISSSPAGVSSGRLSASNRTLSRASEALEISSRRKMSLCEYREWIMRSSSSRTSVWNSWRSVWSLMSGLLPSSLPLATPRSVSETCSATPAGLSTGRAASATPAPYSRSTEPRPCCSGTSRRAYQEPPRGNQRATRPWSRVAMLAARSRRSAPARSALGSDEAQEVRPGHPGSRRRAELAQDVLDALVLHDLALPGPVARIGPDRCLADSAGGQDSVRSRSRGPRQLRVPARRCALSLRRGHGEGHGVSRRRGSVRPVRRVTSRAP